MRLLEKRFWRLVRKGAPDECWIWTGAVLESGYGRIAYRGRTYRAHRLSWEVAHGDPGASCVCHRCDRRLCVNPSHLFVGTHADNMADKVAKGRQARGERNGRCKLTRDDAAMILIDSRPQTKIAADYGVSQAVVSAIKRRIIWNDL